MNKKSLLLSLLISAGLYSKINAQEFINGLNEVEVNDLIESISISRVHNPDTRIVIPVLIRNPIEAKAVLRNIMVNTDVATTHEAQEFVDSLTNKELMNVIKSIKNTNFNGAKFAVAATTST